MYPDTFVWIHQRSEGIFQSIGDDYWSAHRSAPFAECHQCETFETDHSSPRYKLRIVELLCFCVSLEIRQTRVYDLAVRFHVLDIFNIEFDNGGESSTRIFIERRTSSCFVIFRYRRLRRVPLRYELFSPSIFSANRRLITGEEAEGDDAAKRPRIFRERLCTRPMGMLKFNNRPSADTPQPCSTCCSAESDGTSTLTEAFPLVVAPRLRRRRIRELRRGGSHAGDAERAV